MKFPTFRTYAASLLTAGSLAAAAVSLTGCGVFGHSWDVKMEVTGPGSADVGYSFSGDNSPRTTFAGKLPWNKAQNVGFGFNNLAVTSAQPGTVCRIYVDGKLKDEQKKPDAKGTLSCSVHLKD
ncbi:MmpS family transport accessory protein [Streptomyces silvisoli]|uniref:MmpS family transport accessory protein n=1 Tax=Streptomyces silvisoli TaxID=3034235 RepID=A0ABT5ZUD2_9ACTN|nr:MmpS family transport accessory protein [Streptomyces silvisoli]MDF3293256.1 MmpS family transport accessory protein [Streptomyces silvisoli]